MEAVRATVGEHRSELPDQFVLALAKQAEEDAGAVARLLTRFGVRQENQGSDTPPLQLPSAVLIGFALATRFARWEVNGIKVHVDAGLPSAQVVLARVALGSKAPDFGAFIQQVRHDAFQVFYDSFLWSGGGAGVTADLAMTVVQDEEQFLEVMADVLWEQATKRL